MLPQPLRNKRHAIRWCLGAATAVFCLTSAGVSQAQAPQDLKELQKKIEAERSAADQARAKSGIMAQDILNLQHEMVTAAAAVQRHEQQVSALNTRLTALERLQEKKSADLRDGRARFGRILSAMQRMAQYPPEALIAQPTKPADTVRTAILLRAAGTEIDAQADKLREELDFLAKARTEIEERRIALAETSDLLDRERRRLGALMARKKVLKRRADLQASEAEARVAAMASKARSLQELLKGLEAEKERERAAAAKAATAKESDSRKTVEQASATVRRALRPISKARGAVPRPVVGKIAGKYGEKTDGGLSRKGVTFSTPASAQVTATYDGTVAFAGKFRGYGLLLIIEHGEGYHTLLAGMARIDVSQGQQVVAGEPVGVMEESGAPVLYVELRRDGQPINPMPWLAARTGEVNG